jgi:hypothetical protein
MNARTSRPNHATGGAAAWALLGLLATADVALEARSPLPVEPASTLALALAFAALSAAALFYARVRPRRQFVAMCVGLTQVLLFSALGIVLSYLLAREGGALWDNRFMAWDRALGFDWLGYVRFVDAHSWLAAVLGASYASLIPQVIVVVVALGFSARLEELSKFILAGIVCGTVTILLSPLFPALSCYVHLGLPAHHFRNLDPAAGYSELRDYVALKRGSLGVLRLPRMQGIIAFPSYHAGLAAVTLWSFWSSRNAWLRWPGVALALATIVSAPVDGGHYFVDVIAGLVVAACSIAAAQPLARWSPGLQPFRASPFRRSREAFAP